MTSLLNKNTSNRHQFRAEWHDYNYGVYFVTICCRNRQHLLGQIVNERIILSKIGDNTKQCLESIPEHHKNTEIWNYVIMPNHIHLIIYIKPEDNNIFNRDLNHGCLNHSKHDGKCLDFHHNSQLAKVIGSFKAAVSRSSGIKCWQSRFHDHFVRNRQSYNFIMDYIDNNISNWDKDCFYK